MGADWIESLDKRPTDRTGYDLDLIFSKLKGIKAFESFQPMLLQQLCYYGYYESLDKGVTLFRHGDVGTNWYVCLSGSVDVVLPTDNSKVQTYICTLGSGTAFGESILYDMPRNATIITSDACELLRVEQKDFKILWAKNKEYMQGVISSLSKLAINPDPKRRASEFDPSLIPGSLSNRLEWKDDPCRNPALPIVTSPSSRIENSAYVLRSCILSTAPQMIRDRKYHLQTHESCLVGSEMVDWLIHLSPVVHSRSLAIGMWQALLEEGTIEHVNREHYFKDKYLFYRFTVNDDWRRRNSNEKTWEEQLKETIILLAQIGPDANLRMILRKPPHERTVNDLDIIYEELVHVKALSHLSSLVKKELAAALLFEAHPYKNTIIFNQGDEPKSWYIILKGSVDVSINGKGIVATLCEGDDFGKLSLVNKTPRTATIITRENNCHFLRVDKDDFNRILKDVEANTVRLMEHGKDVLVLEKIPFNTKNDVDGTLQACYKYSVTIGAAEKILEHVLETRILCKNDDTTDTFVEDFLMTYIVFLPVQKLCPILVTYYQILDNNKDFPNESSIANKRRVVAFVKEWCDIAKDAFYEEPTISQLLQDILNLVKVDSKVSGILREELKTIETIIECDPYAETEKTKKIKFIWRKGSRDVAEKLRKPIRPQDESIFKVYCADHTYTTLKMRMDTPASRIMALAAEKLSLNVGNGLVLCEVRSNGERTLFKENDVSITTSLSINGRLFLSPNEHLDALTPLPEQEGPTKGTWQILEMFSSKEIAYYITLHDWELFNAVHPYELIYQVFGRHKFNKITANLDLFMRRFNEVQFWVCSELCLCPNLGKRVSLLRKFIKLASHCKEYQNLNSFFAIIMGLSNVAISRLSLTWEKLPSKFKKMFSEFESALDPSRNHRRYRVLVEQMQPPIIPFMPLLLKDMTFIHEGNKTFFNGLVNFEKMRFLSNTIRTMRKCRSSQLEIPVPQNMKYFQEIKDYMQNLKVIDNQRVLTQLSSLLEPRRT